MTMTNPIPIEIERKYLIRMPDTDRLSVLEGCTVSHITQTYLNNPDGAVERVRERIYSDHTSYTHTIKKRIDQISAREEEYEISRDEYASLLLRADVNRIPIRKTRYAVPYAGHTAEIDVYPFWDRQAVLEIELTSEDDKVPFPSFLQLIREVSGNHKYSNNALSLKIPEQDP